MRKSLRGMGSGKSLGRVMLDRSMSSLGKSQLQLCTHVQWKNRKMKMGFIGVWQFSDIW